MMDWFRRKVMGPDREIGHILPECRKLLIRPTWLWQWKILREWKRADIILIFKSRSQKGPLKKWVDCSYLNLKIGLKLSFIRSHNRNCYGIWKISENWREQFRERWNILKWKRYENSGRRKIKWRIMISECYRVQCWHQ